MAAEETMGSTPPRESAPAATARGDVSAAVVGAKHNTSRVSVLKRMMDNDDDDDSSSDDDEKPKKAAATSAEGKEVKGSDAAVQETHSKQKSRSRGEAKQKMEKRAKKEKQPKKEKRAEKRERDEKKESSKKKEVVISELSAGIKVRSERLQMRAAIMESTTNVAVVTPDEKAKARKKEDAKKKEPKKEEVSTPPRKRRRVNSSDSVVQEVEKNAHGKKDDVETSALKRLTRKESREALKKQHDHEREETTKASEKVTTTTAEVLKEDVATLAESVPTITEPKKGPNAATSDDDEKKTVTTKSTDEDVGSTRPHKPRNLKRSRDERDAAATQALQEGVTKEKQSQLKRRSKVISDESDASEQEDRTTGDKPRKADHRRDTHSTKERSSAKINGEEANEKKRKRLKRPLSPASSNGTKSGSRTALPDREDSEGATTYSVRASSKGRSDHGKPSTSHDKRERKKHQREDFQLERGEKRKMEAHQEPKSTVVRDDRGREDRKAGKHRLSKDNDERMKSRLKKERIAALGATTLNDFIEHEKRESRKHGKDMERGSEGGRFTQGESETASADKETLYSGFTESEGRGARESDHPKEEAAGEPEPQNETPGSMNEGSKAIKAHVHPSSPEESSMSGQAPVTSTPSSDLQVPAQITTTVATTVEEDDEEGAVSDEEKSGAGEKSGTDTASVENQVGTEQADPMSFVIPKKRPTSVVVGRSPPKRDTQAVAAQRQSGSKDSLTPTPLPSPESSVDTSIPAVPGKPRLRTKNAVLPKMTPLSQQEKDFFHLARKCNSLLKAASVTRLRGSNAANPRLVSAFGCTSDRYGAMLETGKQYVELTKRMACPTRKEIKNSDHPPSFFGVVMVNPPDKERDAMAAPSPAANEPAPSTAIPCYETLEFAKTEDRDWYLKRMYGTTFVPQLLRERVTLVMRNARYVRRSTGLLFNAQRDKEEYATQIAERYTVNRSVPRCDILQKNWQLLVNGRTTFVFLHYMNREDAMIARAQFKDDDGLSLIIKGESRASELAAANNGMRAAMSPGLSPPPLSSPPQAATRRRSRSRSNGHSSPRRPDFPEQRGREMDRDRGSPQRHDGRGGPWPPRDRSLDRGRGRRRGGRSSLNGSDARNGSRYGPASLSRSPPRRASHSRSRSPRPPSQQDVTGRPLSPESSHQDRNLQVPTERVDECENKEDGESSSQGAEVSSQTKDTSKNGDETSGHRVDHIDDRRHLDDGRSAGQQQRVRSRSRSRPRHPDDRQPPSPHSGRRGSEDRSFQYDGRSSSEYYGRGGPQRRSPPPHMHMGDRDRHGHEHGRYRGHEQGRYGGHDHPHAEQAFFDDRARPSRDYDRRGHQGDHYRRQHHHDERRFH